MTHFLFIHVQSCVYTLLLSVFQQRYLVTEAYKILKAKNYLQQQLIYCSKGISKCTKSVSLCQNLCGKTTCIFTANDNYKS